ncbi:hypothetical protein [Knoellia aerolata]|uniref:Integral membrane protein n=1 Tax=Knoellia aerolata DSM 18566 TaxID=1385519 RepID=A0A0A0JRY1_9MICO|nr:hypothetical protein [Knoellia aerolata]KGN40205.1 hypothetical protein N801_16185 [Knoellia aerolata DSM 18566]
MGSASLDRRRSAVGWLLALVVLTLYGTIPLSLAGDVLQRPGVVSPHSDLWIGPIVAAFALSGAALTHLRPWNVIGWLLLLSALLQVTNLAANAYSIRALTDPDGSLPLGLATAWVASWTWLPSLLLVALVLPAVYPTGHPPSRYWTWHVRLTVVALVVATVLLGVAPGAVDDGVAGTELPWSVPAWALWVVGAPTVVLLAGSAGSVIVGTAWRAVRASAPERQQLLWLLSVVALMVGTVFTEYRLLFGL